MVEHHVQVISWDLMLDNDRNFDWGKQHALCLKLNGGLETNRRLVSDMAVQQPSDEGFLLPEISLFFSKSCLLHPAISGGCVCYAYDEKIRLA